MELAHFIGFAFFLAIIIYLGLNNSTGVAQIFNAGGPQVVNLTKALQGRG